VSISFDLLPVNKLLELPPSLVGRGCVWTKVVHLEDDFWLWMAGEITKQRVGMFYQKILGGSEFYLKTFLRGKLLTHKRETEERQTTHASSSMYRFSQCSAFPHRFSASCHPKSG
jgi:hypothetical protein